MTMKPLISIVIAVFNGVKTLQKCIDSVTAQSYKNVELIIMDGASSDGTTEVLKRNESSIAYYESQEDRGIAHAWNKALDRVKGDWILFLGADDRLIDVDVLSDMADILVRDIENDVVYGQIIYDGGAFHGQVYGGHFDLYKLKRRMVVPHTAAFHRRKYFIEVGKFDESFKIAIDYEILLRKRSLSARFVKRHVAVMGGEGVSSRLIENSLQEFRDAQLKNKIDWQVKIEFWYVCYRLKYQFDIWRKN